MSYGRERLRGENCHWACGVVEPTVAIELSPPDVFVDVSTSDVVYRFGRGLLVGLHPTKLYRGIRLNRVKSMHFIRNVLSAFMSLRAFPYLFYEE